MEDLPVVVEAFYDASVAAVWKALTDNEQMRQWYFPLEAFRAEPGFQFRFEGGTENRTYTHLCEIVEVIPENKLVHSWKYLGYPGFSLVTFELNAARTGTRLTVTHEGLETFPKVPDFARENFKNGWTAITGNSLKSFLEKG